VRRRRPGPGPRNITTSRGTGTQDPFSGSRLHPCLPWSGSRPRAGVEEGLKWREQSQFAGPSKCLCDARLSGESSPAWRANKANFAEAVSGVVGRALAVDGDQGSLSPSASWRPGRPAHGCVAVSECRATERRHRTGAEPGPAPRPWGVGCASAPATRPRRADHPSSLQGSWDTTQVRGKAFPHVITFDHQDGVVGRLQGSSRPYLLARTASRTHGESATPPPNPSNPATHHGAARKRFRIASPRPAGTSVGSPAAMPATLGPHIV
jgi:hypothetical protein